MSLEDEIRAFVDAGDLEKAATRAIDGYGRELLGYLVATMRNEDDASEVFSQLGEDIWRGLPDFEWRCSFRTWAYYLARSAAARHIRRPHNRADRRVPLSRISEVAVRVRTETLPHLRTEVKDRFAELRASLSPDDQALLILRVNRQLSWKEIAMILGDVPPGDDAELKRASARFRQRFQAVKKRMHALAETAGLLRNED